MKPKILVYIFLTTMMTIFLACSTSNESNTTTIKINLGLSQNKCAKLNSGDFITKAAAPDDLTGDITLFVSGPGMNTITTIIPQETGELTLTVPSGDSRTFEVRATREPATGDFTVIGLRGTDVRNLLPGASVTISIQMERATFSVNYIPEATGIWTIPYSLDIDESSIYIAGYYNYDGEYWRIEKRNINTGELVSEFNDTGFIEASQDGIAYSIKCYSDSIYIAGTGNYNSYFSVEKRDKITGQSDTNFTYTPLQNLYSYPFSLAVNSSLLYVGGTQNDGNSDYYWYSEYIDPISGSMSFSQLSSSLGNMYFADQINSVDMDEQYIYIAGDDYSSDEGKWRIEKRNIGDGSLVVSFGNSGVVLSDPDIAQNETLKAIAIDNSYIYCAGSDYDANSNKQIRLEKRNITNGSLITEFGTNGVFNYTGIGYGCQANSIAIDNDYIYIAGFEITGDTIGRWLILKIDINTGQLDASFGTNGIIYYDPRPDTGEDKALSIAVDDTFIYITGSVYTQTDASERWCVQKRYKSTGGF